MSAIDDLDEIWMNGDFTATEALKLRKGILKHAEMGPEFPIVIYINSYGGSVDALNSIFDTLDSIPNQIVTVCSGTAMSCGAMLLAYGDVRFMGKNSRVMLHQVSHGTFGTIAETSNSTKEIVRLNKEIIKILADCTKRSVEEIEELFGTNVDKFFNAEQARKFGIVDKIGVPKLYPQLTYILK